MSSAPLSELGRAAYGNEWEMHEPEMVPDEPSGENFENLKQTWKAGEP